jgi:hypothetical protein
VEVLWNDGGNTNTRIEVWLDATGSTSGENDANPNSPVACIGARLQLYAGTYAHGCEVGDQPLHLGLGGRKKLDVVRITWPGGQVQNALDVRVPANHRLLFRRETRGS